MYPLAAILRSPGGQLYPPVVLGTISDTTGYSSDAVVLDDRGRGWAVWQGPRNELLARRFQAP